MGFVYPAADGLPPIRGIHPADMRTPVLCQSIILRRKVVGTFGIAGLGADIQGKMKIRVEGVEECLWGCPLRCLVAMVHWDFLSPLVLPIGRRWGRGRCLVDQ